MIKGKCEINKEKRSLPVGEEQEVDSCYSPDIKVQNDPN